MKATIFGWDLTRGQLKIVGSVLDPTVKRLIISATTQYGKTRAVAIAILIDLVNHADDGVKKKVGIIAPTTKQTSIIRNFIAEHIAENRFLADLVDKPSHTTPEHLKSEVSKERLTFKNGWSITTLTAHGEEGSKDPGKQLMGFGFDIVVLDDAGLILDEVYRKGIKRMLGANPDAKLIILLNPWHRDHFAYRAWKSSKFKQIHIGWQQAVSEGRVTQEFIEDQREELTPMEFTVLYDSLFPEDSEDTLIRWNWIEAAATRKIAFTETPKPIWGLDVAEKGVDLTILTYALTDGDQYAVQSQQWIKEKDTMPTANKASELVPKTDTVNVDSIGVGAGVHSRLNELGHKAVSIRVSESPTVTPERFENLKSQRWWALRTLFEHGKIGIPHEFKLMSQLSQMRYEITMKGKIRIVDPTGKSPDYADSLMLTISDTHQPLGGGSISKVNW